MIKPPIINDVDFRYDTEYVNAIKQYCTAHNITFYEGIESFVEVIYNHTGEAISRFYQNNPMYYSNDFDDYFGGHLEEVISPFSNEPDYTYIDHWELMIKIDYEELSYNAPSWYKDACKDRKAQDLKEDCIRCYKKTVLNNVSFNYEDKTFYLADVDTNNLTTILSNKKIFNKIQTIQDKTILKLFDVTASHSYVASAIEDLNTEDKRKYLLNELKALQLFFDLYDLSKNTKTETSDFIKVMYQFIEEWSVAKDFLYQQNSWATEPNSMIKKCCNYWRYKENKEDKEEDLEKKTKVDALKCLIVNNQISMDKYISSYDVFKHLFVNSEHYFLTVNRINNNLRYWYKIRNAKEIEVCTGRGTTKTTKKYRNCFKELFKKELLKLQENKSKSSII